MKSHLQCEVCNGAHRVIRWRTPAGGMMRLCVLCRHALAVMAQWQLSHSDVALDSLIAQLPAFLPDLPAIATPPKKQVA